MEEEKKQIDEKKIIANEKIIEENDNSPVTIPLSRKMRWIVFVILTIVTIIMGLDQGILSSTTATLRNVFHISDGELGGLGSMIFLGTAIGCLCSFTLINKFNRKYLLLGTMCFDVLSLFFTTQTTNLLLLYFCRVIAGFTQSFLSIYVPVWSDQFGIHKYKSIMLSIIHLSSSLGYLFGYILGTLLNWDNSFYLENILIIIHIIIIFMFLPDKYFSMNLMPLKAKKELNHKEELQEEEKNLNIEDEQLINQMEGVPLNRTDSDIESNIESNDEKSNKEKEYKDENEKNE